MKLELTIETPDGLCACDLFHPAGAGPWPALLFFQDGIGVRDSLRDMAASFAEAGYAVLLPNMYHRAGAYEPFDPATVFSDAKERARVLALIGSFTPAQAMADTAAFLAFLRGEAIVAPGKIGCVGYCLGGFLALQAAAAFPDDIAVAASIHGARLVTESPESPHRLASKMRAFVYVAAAEIDHGFSEHDRARLDLALTEAGVRHEVALYPGVSHGFAVPDVPVYDRAAAERQRARVLELLRAEIG